ncbi:MAG: hypothetical protein ABIH70_07420 [Chloroflexota bacterium]
MNTSPSAYRPEDKPQSEPIGFVPNGNRWWVGSEGIATDTPPPKSPQEIIEETRQLAFTTLNGLVGNNLLGDEDAEKWFGRISQAPSEAELRNIIETLGAIGGGQSFQFFK